MDRPEAFPVLPPHGRARTDHGRTAFPCGSEHAPDLQKLTRTRTPAMQEVFTKAGRVAPTRTTVLLTGETGVGKSTVARLIHALSNRAGKPFVSIHCGAIPENLVESELFGHEKGAFTGAVRQKPGKFEVAHGGTVFLDEVGTLPPSSQIKLLDVLQSRTFQRVGGTHDIEVDIRVVAATNDDLEALCREGRFRKDLFYRINVFTLDIPPLRERAADLPALVESLLVRLQPGEAEPILEVEPEVLEALTAYDWPGNVRELENLLERALILETGEKLSRESFPAEIFQSEGLVPVVLLDSDLPLEEVRRHAVEEVEQAYLRQILDRFNGRIDRSASHAGITTRQLHKLMTKHGLHKEDFKERRDKSR
ncbi:MAG: sigma-54 interaction domain-containing protein [Desulfovibrio sp.]